MALVKAYRTHGTPPPRLDPLGMPPPGDPRSIPIPRPHPGGDEALPASVLRLSTPGDSLADALHGWPSATAAPWPTRWNTSRPTARRTLAATDDRVGTAPGAASVEEHAVALPAAGRRRGLRALPPKAYLDRAISIEGVTSAGADRWTAHRTRARAGAPANGDRMAHRAGLNVLAHRGPLLRDDLREFESAKTPHWGRARRRAARRREVPPRAEGGYKTRRAARW